ncbi:MAG: hypothetical protein JNK77_13385 [Saprospiraceae bacterium]|nr:hypothetical protein [Saprospiraceae bacterium]
MRIYTLLALLGLLTACGINPSSTTEEGHPLSAYFYASEFNPTDTLVFYAEQQEFENNTRIKPLPDTVLAKYVSPEIMARLNFTGSGEYFSAYQFSLDSHTIACVILTRDNWFRMESLLLFNKKNKKYDRLMPVAQLYGGESGQIYTHGWLYKQDMAIYLFSKEITHSIIMPTEENEEPVEKDDETNSLKRWRNDNFESIALR